jgi:uncharacterized protein (TIGR02145 family)
VTNATDRWIWSCNWSNWWSNASCSRSRAYCTNYTNWNGTFITGTPTSSSQIWQTTNSSSPCYVSCNTWYTWNSTSKSCVSIVWTPCSTAPDIIIWGYTIKACNVGASVVWTWSDSFGSYYDALIANTNVSNLCPTGYHVPTINEWDNLISASGLSQPNFSNKLFIPFAWCVWWAECRRWWTYLSSSNKTNSWYNVYILKNFYDDRFATEDSCKGKCKSRSVRCFKN